MERIHKSFWCPHGSNEKPQDYRLMLATFCQDCNTYMSRDSPCSYCDICYTTWHASCVPSSPEDINHPYHPYHPLKLVIHGQPDYSNSKCNTCKEDLKLFFYHCSICDFSIHVRCSKNPPPLVLDAPKCHKHTLICMARNDTFTCNACGTQGEYCPYVCAPCSLMFHRDCTKLPHVININRHEDRISHTYALGFGDWKCMICHKKIDWRYGAYSCMKCPNYVVHSKCATTNDVWDGVELEGVPEEFFDVSPFKVIEEGVINHFSHQEHNLRIVEDGIERDKSLLCEACIHPIFSEKHYSCVECNFTLHETCANLPVRKRHAFSTTPFTLISTKNDENEDFFMCQACDTYSNGFRYESGSMVLDVRCVTVTYYCDYECHPHPLFLTTTELGICGGCHEDTVFVLNCVECDYSLCFKCATLPKKIRHRSDDHFLSLRFGEKGEGKYWCEVCETVLDPQNWFYTCEDCVVVCHIGCVLGDLLNVKQGIKRMSDKEKAVLVSNDSMSRPKCGFCGFRCKLPLVLNYFSSRISDAFCRFECLEQNDM